MGDNFRLVNRHSHHTVRFVEPTFTPSPKQYAHLKRIAKIGRGKAKRRSKAHYRRMGKLRWEKYREEKKAMAKAVLSEVCAAGAK